jgi:hypothetical protein
MNRICELDVIKCFAIFWVILLHSVFYLFDSCSQIPELYFYAFGFGLATFAWTSGYILGLKDYHPETTTAATISRFARNTYANFLHLLLPAVILIYINMVITGDYYIFYFISFKKYYYVGALFSMLLINDLVKSLTRNNRKLYITILILLSALSMVFLAVISGKYDCNKYFILDSRQGLFFFPFFTMGIICGLFKQWFNALIHSTSFLIAISCIFITTVVGLRIIFSSSDNIEHINTSALRQFLMFLCPIFAATIVFRFYNTFCRKCQYVARFLTFIGRHTLAIYLLHWYMISWPKIVTECLPTTNDIVRAIVAVAVATMSATICAYVAIGLRKLIPSNWRTHMTFGTDRCSKCQR